MNLNYLKPAWRQFRFLNSMHSVSTEEILSIIEQAEVSSVSRVHRCLLNSTMFAVLVICCQGG